MSWQRHVMDEQATIHVRAAHAEDFPALLEIWSEFVEMYTTFDYDFEVAENAPDVILRSMREGLERGDTLILLAEEGGRVCGFLRGWTEDNIPGYLPVRKGFIHEIIVRSEHRGHHVGQQLLKGAVEWFREQKIESIEVKISGKNSVARAFWGIEGFKEKQFVMELDLNEID
jgi:GNAT superfamily N-acetyltransferase